MFKNVEFDLRPAYGWQGGPSFRTRVVSLRNGHERRNAERELVQHRFLLPFQNITDESYRQYLKGFFLAMRGQLYSFKVRDPSDYIATDESLGVAPSGTTAVQLVKVSSYGGETYSRTITKPVNAVVKQNGTIKPGTVDTLTGLFTPSTAWTAGQPLTWSGEFRIPMRFASDDLSASLDSYVAGGRLAVNASVELIEVFGE